uniref:Retrotransposable element Tf2 n=1 Tax=Cajanus cajan TaxID=3821 RepID=A0A151U459_CAJCA|nr:Retrotransposable element Tf2 [Cajanus cajan]
MDGYLGYNQIKMAIEDHEKMTFITPWGTFCYRVMPFILKNAGATYQRAIVTLFHNIIHKEVEVYVDDIIAKLKSENDHFIHLRKLFNRLRKYKLKLNPAKCTFRVRSRKLLRFIVREKGIEVDPDKAKTIIEMSPPKTEMEVRRFLGRVNYIARFISQLTDICTPIFKLLRKNQPMEWNEECQISLDRIKQCLTNPPILMPPIEGKPLILYLIVLQNTMGCLLGKLCETNNQEGAIYYLSKKFTGYEAQYLSLEKTCCALVDIEMMNKNKNQKESWSMFFDGASNLMGHRIDTILMSSQGKHIPVMARLDFEYTNNMYMLKTFKSHPFIGYLITDLKTSILNPIFALVHGYKTSVRTMIGATPFSLVYGMEAVLPIEVEIPSLRLLVEAKLPEAEWVQARFDQLNLIEEKRLDTICHGQTYQRRIKKAFDKKVQP